MLILKTVAHETVWGGERLLPYSDGTKKKIGHLYSLCCEKRMETVILNDPYRNQPFHSYFLDHRERFGLGCYDEFPLVIALVEARDNLSIQVHPDDRTARELENAPYGKNESWYFLEAPRQGEIFNGCRSESVNDVQGKIQSDEMMSVVDTLPVKSGDYVYVEAGTLHALSAGSLVYEIEENSPWTYRLYDYNRRDEQGHKRPLHIEKALKALKPRLKSKAFPLGGESQEERRYVLKKLERAAEYINDSETLECVTILDGSCEAEGLKATVGTTIVLEPGERLAGELTLAMVARPK